MADADPDPVRIPTPAAAHDAGRRLAALLRAGDLLVLTGDLGAGKTTLTQGIGAGLGVQGQITSPTFVIARHHRPGPARPGEGQGPGLVHVDAYRLTGLAELDDLDLDTDLAHVVTVVEWGEGLAERLDEAHLRLVLTRVPGQDAGVDGAVPDAEDAEDTEDSDLLDTDARAVHVSGAGARWGEAELAAVRAALHHP